MLNSILIKPNLILAFESIRLTNIEVITVSALTSFVVILVYLSRKYYKLKKDWKIKEKTIGSKKKEINRLKKKIINRTQNLENALQKAEESSRLKSLFLANMSHEIRTPLNGIMGFSELIIEDNIDLNSKNLFAHQINQNSQNLLNLIDQIFHLSIIETGKVSINKEEFKIVEVLNKLEPKILRTIEDSKKNIKLSINIENHDYFIITDKLKFELILENLFDNAIKFTNQGIIELTCFSFEEKYLFQLTDSGCGLLEDEYELIFDPFTQGEKTFKMIKGGSGLGLSNVKNYVILLGGKIWCEKNKPTGSIFNFYLPAPKISKEDLLNMTHYPLFHN